MSIPTAIPLLVCVAIVMTGCGDGASAPSPGRSAQTGADDRSANASAGEVAKQSRGRVKCPAKLAALPREAAAPVDDVLGVRPGMTYDEAVNVVLCTHELLVIEHDASSRYDIQTYGATIRQGFGARFAQARVEKSSKQIVQEMQDDMFARSGNSVREDMRPGQSKWFVGTIGMPQQERVIGVAREEWFEEGRNPTLASVEEALIGKYGTPSRADSSGRRWLTWIRDPAGRFVTDTSPLSTTCVGNSRPGGGENYSPDCGLVVTAMIFPMPDNPALARYFQVGIVDQAGGYERITGTEQTLQQQEAQRRAEAVRNATTNAAKPKL